MTFCIDEMMQALFRCIAPLIFVAFLLQYAQKVQRTEIKMANSYNIPVRCTLSASIVFITITILRLCRFLKDKKPLNDVLYR